MARLLLVDDNPSIHKIAETLLGPSYVELVCVGSAEAALALIEGGQSFDVALLDTTMPGMDGWELLGRLRANPGTSRIPIAMMAGVLDNVDPEKLSTAPIQGFLKKPIELRDLPDRVRQLLGTPVSGTGTFPIPAQSAPPVEMPEFVPTLPSLPEPEPEFSPYATLPPGTARSEFTFTDPSELETQPPGTKLSDLTGENPLDSGDLVTLPPGTKLTDLPGISTGSSFPGLELDLLLLTPEDLLDEAEALPPEAELDLEELDLEGLRDIQLEPAALPPFVPEPVPAASMAGPEAQPALLEPAAAEVPTIGSFPMELPESGIPAGAFEVVTGEVISGDVVTGDVSAMQAQWAEASSLPSAELPPIQTLDLDAGPVPSLDEWPPMLEPEPAPPSHPLSAVMAAGTVTIGTAGLVAAALAAPEALPEPAPARAPVPSPPVEEIPPSAITPTSPTPPFIDSAAVMVEGEGPEFEVVNAILANPMLLEALSRAVVAQLGDQVLREIAWEVIPELAEKLHRPSK